MKKKIGLLAFVCFFVFGLIFVGVLTTQEAAAGLPRNGTYTFFPRPQAHRGGVDTNLYLHKIVVRSGYFSMFFTGSPVGSGGDGNYHGIWNNQRLTNLDNPSQGWEAVNRGEDDDAGGTGGFFLTFQGVVGTRFSLTGNDNPPTTFDEIILGEPDR